MKRIITIVLAMTIALAASAQKNITKFLGIPVDGTKTAMIQKLKAKGFTYDAENDVFSGEFNGRDVNLFVVTNNNNKVYRIVVSDAEGSSEAQIKTRFNDLCQQFDNSDKYIAVNLDGHYEIGDGVDISDEIALNEDRFAAGYYQYAEADSDTTGMFEWMMYKLVEDYGDKLESMTEEEQDQVATVIAEEYFKAKMSHKSVWFMINRDEGEYYIVIYYDNDLNRSDGDDL